MAGHGDGELSGRVALVTGATGNIGRALIRSFAAAGAAVVVTDRDEHAVPEFVGELAAAGVKALGGVVDVTDAAQVGRVVEDAGVQLGPVDVLVNNAAVAPPESFLDAPAEVWDRELDVIVKGAVHCSRAVLPGMLERRRGSIVNIASVNGLAFYGDPAYSAAKAALLSLTRSLAAMYGESGVRVNALAPGTIRGPIWDNRLARDPDTLTKLARWYPLGRIGEPEDVAEAACFLCSDRAAWISGVVLPVDGGLGAGNVEMARDTGGF